MLRLYALALATNATANNSITAEFRLYRNGTLLTTRTFIRNLNVSGVQRFNLADTYVDTSPATVLTTYELRVIVTSSNSITSVEAVNRYLNIIRF